MYSMVVIDDEFIVVEGIKAMINREKLNYEIVGFAYDGIKALEVIQQTKPDVVITDIRIPGLDGLSLIEEAKEFTPKTSFIVISGYSEFEYAKRALSLGVKGYLDKPITIEKITEVLNRIEKELLTKEEEALERKEGYQSEGMQLFNGFVDRLIKGIMNESAGEIKIQTEKILEVLASQSYTLAVYKQECYKFLCVANGIFLEQKRQYELEDMASYKEVEVLSSYAEVDEYVRDITGKIAEKMEAVKSGSNHRIILKLLAIIQEKYNENIGLNELADMVNMNPAYLSILFKEEVGMTYIKYLTQLRINHARDLLAEGFKVTQVSEMVGYNDYHYFCSIFKKHTGKKPNELKGSIRKK